MNWGKHWRDVSWTTSWTGRSMEKVTIIEVIDHLSAQEAVDVNVLELSQYIDPGGIPNWQFDPVRVTAASLMYPIIIVKSAGQYKHILDGNHRFQKAINEEIESIKAKILDLDNPETPDVFKRMFGIAG